MMPDEQRPFQPDQSDPFLAAVLSSIASVGHRSPTSTLAATIAGLTERPLRLAREHIHWPTGMGIHNIPAEVSVSLRGSDQTTFRILADLQDHRFRLAANWSAFVEAGARITGQSPVQVARLMARHMDIDPPNTRTPVYHGVRYGRTGHQSSLYFSTVTWSKALLQARIPASTEIVELGHEGPNAPWVHLAGYDFDEHGKIGRTKLYAWLDRDQPLHKLSDSVGSVAGLEAAQALLDHLRLSHGIEAPSESLLLQFSRRGRQRLWNRKLYLHAPKWHFDNPAGIGHLMQYMTSAWGVDLASLLHILNIFAGHGVKLLPSGIAIDLSKQVPQSVTFYFLPLADTPPTSAVTRAKLKSVHRKAMAALVRQAELGWPEISPRDWAAASSRIRLAVPTLSGWREPAGLPASNAILSPELEAICLAREMLAQLRSQLDTPAVGVGAPRASAWRNVEGESPELNALRLLIGLETKQICGPDLLRAVQSLHQQERWSGGWCGYGDELETTVLVLEALVRSLDTDPSLDDYVAPILRRTIFWLRGTPVPKEPARVALWIKGNLLTGDMRSTVSLQRGLAFLAETQQRDGTWMSSPYESACGDRAWLDAGGWQATALVAQTLDMFLR